jgi:tetratricopeptide (TPR) repeat protein
MARDAVPPLVRLWYSHFYLVPIGRAHDAVSEIGRLLNDDPLNVVARWCRGICLTADDRDLEADAEFRRCLELDEFPMAAVNLGLLCALNGNLDEALALAERAHAVNPWSLWSLGLLAGALWRTEHRDRAEALLEKLQSGDAYGAPAGLAVFHTVCGEADQATDWLGKAIDQRFPTILSVLARPAERVFKASSHWTELERRINLSEVTRPHTHATPTH